VDRIRLIEPTEGHTSRLSAEGTGLWEEQEFLRESVPNPEEPGRMAFEYDVMERIFELPAQERSSPAGSRNWWAAFAGLRRRSAGGSPVTATGPAVSSTLPCSGIAKRGGR
jgi:hypothetical protein